MNPRDTFEARLAATLVALRSAGLLRQMRLPQGIDLVSNDYLGFAEHPYIKERIHEAVAELPAGAGGSRLLRGHHEPFERLESRLATFSGSDAALLFGFALSVRGLGALPSPLFSRREISVRTSVCLSRSVRSTTTLSK